MLSLSLKSSVKRSPLYRRLGRRYTTEESNKLVLVETITSREALDEIKVSRFGRDLELYKEKTEQPILETYADVAKEKEKRTRGLHSRNSRRTARFNKRDKHLDSIQKGREEDTIYEDMFRTVFTYNERKMIYEPISFYDYMMGKSEDTRNLTVRDLDNFHHNTFEPLDFEARDSDRPISLTDYLVTQMPKRFDLSGRQWEYERGLPKTQLLQTITSDLLKHGLNVQEDRRPNLGTYKGLLEKHFDLDIGDAHPIGGIDRAFDERIEIVDVEQPLISQFEEIKGRFFKSRDSNFVDFNNHDYPFILESVDFPFISGMEGKTDNIPVELILRKAVLRVFVDNLNLPEHVEERFIELAGRRYDPETNVVKLVSRVKSTKHENIGNVYKMFKRLVSESWKADLNYVPPKQDPVPPHQQVIIDNIRENIQKEEEEAHDPNSYTDKDTLKIFRIYETPIKYNHNIRKPKDVVGDITKL